MRYGSKKYFFYVVLNAGNEKAHIKKLKKPIKLWKEDVLYADIVSIKLQNTVRWIVKN